MTQVFVSYSRKDKTCAERFTGALNKSELDTWIDWQDIPPTADWLDQIHKGIEQVDGFLFLLSPDSVMSKVCRQEIDYAVENGKRLIPIVARDVDPSNVHPALAKVNWIYCREQDSFDQAIEKTLTAIRTDLAWVEVHRRLQVRALEWNRRKDGSLLLRGKDLKTAEEQLAGAGRKDPLPTDLQRQYLLESRRRESWIRNAALIVGVVVLATLTFLSLFANNQRILALNNAGTAVSNANAAATAQINAENQKATAQANAAIARARELAAKAQLVMNSDPQTALLLSIESLRLYHTFEGDSIVREGIAQFPELVLKTKGNSLGFSPDAKLVVFQDEDNTLHIWNLDTKQEIASIGQNKPVEQIQITPDNRLLVTDHSKIWDIHSGQEVFGEVARNTKLVLSPSGNLIATTGEDGFLRLWNSTTGKPIAGMEHGEMIDQVVFSPDESEIVSASRNETKLWKITPEGLVASLIHGQTGGNILFSPDSKVLYIDELQGMAHTFDTQTGAEIIERNFKPPIQQAIATEGAIGILASDGVYLWYLADNTSYELLNTKSEYVKGIAFVEIPRSVNPFISVAIWSWNKIQICNAVQGCGTPIDDRLGFGQMSADGSGYAVVEAPELLQSDYHVKFTNFMTGGTKDILTRGNYFRFSNGANWVVMQDSSFGDANSEIWRLNGPNYVRLMKDNDQDALDLSSFAVGYLRVQLGGISNGDTSLMYSCDENMGAMSIMESGTNFEFASKPETDMFRCPAMAVSSDFKQLALGWADHVAVWDIKKQEKIAELSFHGGNTVNLVSPGINSIAFSADNSRLIAGGLDVAIVWDTKTWQQKFSHNFRLTEGQSVLNAALSQNGLWAVITIGPGMAHIWNIETGQEISEFSSVTSAIDSAAFIEGDEYIKTQSEFPLAESQKWLWRAEDLAREGCAHTIRNLSRDEWNIYMGIEPYRATCPQWPLGEEATPVP
jgi:WD40 repeat protein